MRIHCRGVLLAFFTVSWIGTLPGAWAEDSSYQPYIDQVKRQMEEADRKSESSSSSGQTGSSSTPFLDSVRKKLEDEDQKHPAKSSESYIDQLKAAGLQGEDKKSENYTEKLKQEIEPKESTGAIQAVKEGRSELEMKRPGQIHHAVGIRYAHAPSRSVQGNAGAILLPFQRVYPSDKYAPEISLSYEYQFFHSETYGNIGAIGSVGVNYFSGKGQFAFSLDKPGGGTFGLDSLTEFKFITVPVMVGLNYRFNLFKYLRPQVMIAPTLINYVEYRSDDKPSNRGYSKGLTTSIGVSILLDWISRGSTWDLYSDYAIKHYYLTIDFTRLSPLPGGDLSFSSNGIGAGFTFEF